MTAFRLSHSILISAPAATVWHVTTDVARWADWSPNITAVSCCDGGPLIKGACFDLKQPWQRTRTWIVLRSAAPHLFLVRTVEGEMTALHEVTKTESGSEEPVRALC